MTARFQQIAIATLLLIPIMGCQVASYSNPLVDPDEAKVPTELLGSYLLMPEKPPIQIAEFETTRDDEMGSPSKEYQHIGIAGDDYPPGFVRIVRVNVPQTPVRKIEYSSLVGFAAKVGDHFVLHLPIPKKLPIDETTYQGDWNPENFEGYLLAVITPDDSGLELQLVDPDFIASEIEAGRLEGNYTPVHSVQSVDQSGRPLATPPPELNVTADSESLIVFFQQHLSGDLLMGSATKYKRIK